MEQKTKADRNFGGHFISGFFKWAAVALVVGAVGGVVGTLFYSLVNGAADFRARYPFMLYFLPLFGLLIAHLYRINGMSDNGGTNQVISSVRDKNHPPVVIAPLIFVSTALTNLGGGSAGREGASLQLGGSIGSAVGKLFRFDEKDMSVVVMCGMSSVFSAVFGTPLTAAVFTLEVISVGQIYYASLLPCLGSSLAAYGISLSLGAVPERFYGVKVADFNLPSVLRVALLGVLCALLSMVFCIVMKRSSKLIKSFIKNVYVRILAGSAAVILLTLICGPQKYNGTGMSLVESAVLHGNAQPWDFALKLLFTAISLGVGFRGGEIVPAFAVGATFGCVFGGFLGLDPGFAAAVGLIATFCGAVNCPIASIFLSVELFGGEGILFFALACAVSFMLSGYYGLYSSQKIVYSKLTARFIDRTAK